MHHQADRSISGRVFSRSGIDQEDDPFSQALRDFHWQGFQQVKNTGFHWPAMQDGVLYFNPGTLGSVSFSLWFYRRNCRPGYWDGARFREHLDRCGCDTDKPSSEPVRWYLAGAVLFCVDRALACYQRRRYKKADLWRDAAQALLFGNLKPPVDKVAAGRKGAAARHVKEKKVQNEICAEFDRRRGEWRSPRSAATALTPLAIARAAALGWEMSEGEAFRTVYGWLLVRSSKKISQTE